MGETVLLSEAFPEAVTLGEALQRLGMTLSVAESCTGGLLGAAVTAVAGSSEWFLGGVIAYSDRVKVEQLGVSTEVLREHGAVSESVAVQLAQGVRERLASNIGIGITGVAGPGGASDAKPAGMIWLAVVADAGWRSLLLSGDAGREANRSRAVATALELCHDIVAGSGAR